MMILQTSGISYIFKAASQHILKKVELNLPICNRTTENEANSDCAAFLK